MRTGSSSLNFFHAVFTVGREDRLIRLYLLDSSSPIPKKNLYDKQREIHSMLLFSQKTSSTSTFTNATKASRSTPHHKVIYPLRM